MIDYRPEAEALFKGIAERQGCRLERHSEAPVELLFSLIGPDPNETIKLGLQNGDELNLGIDDFWSCFFPFEEMKSVFRKTVQGWFTGQSRLVYRWRGKRLMKIELQVKLKDQSWQRVYSHLTSMIFPLWTTRDEIRMRSSPT